MGAPVLTVRTRLFYARRELEAMLGEEPALAGLQIAFSKAAEGGERAERAERDHATAKATEIESPPDSAPASAPMSDGTNDGVSEILPESVLEAEAEAGTDNASDAVRDAGSEP